MTMPWDVKIGHVMQDTYLGVMQNITRRIFVIFRNDIFFTNFWKTLNRRHTHGNAGRTSHTKRPTHSCR